MMPSLFIAHGAPLLAIEENEYTQFLRELGKAWPKPKAVVLFSAHWESVVQKVSDVEEFDTIYDFGGFPEALYRIQYPAKGDQKITEEIKALFAQQRIPFEVDTMRGLDHGAWVVLRMLYPHADIPVISMSVNQRLKPEQHYEIGRALSALREQDILMIGSGGTVHNLRAVNWEMDGKGTEAWAAEFDEWIEQKLTSWETAELFNYETLAPHASFAVPPYGKEHFVPLLYAMGAADASKRAKLLHRSFRYGNLSHSVWQFG
ncbi:dioxygenase family protein [Bacillus tuaregi]|uniref:dioxygenase family protein n=1 Tax=Bacillus tuaregi TaxID=1816695 RepID=UPI0008F84E46|nr:class III extradiol ring-cleavage dioxygenase [Bacillus tuaregi]